ncbi:MAG: phage terminase large subunit [Anaerolineae bacterium]
MMGTKVPLAVDGAAWRPHAGPQMAFHRSTAFEVLYGGAAGGGKTDSLLMEALRYADVPGYHAIIFRRTYNRLTRAGGLVPRSHELLASVAEWSAADYRWTFPSGATLQFGHMHLDADRMAYQGASFAYIGFDELTEFTEAQYRYLFSRARTKAPVPVRVRAATNPGGEGHEWVRRRWWPWLGDEPTAKSGEVRYFTPEGAETGPDDPMGLSRQFIAASLYDNPTLLRYDPGYVRRLQALSLLERERLLNGNWAITPKGNVFRRKWFRRIVDRAPDDLRWARYWDLAASTRDTASYTASIAAALGPDGTLYLRDLKRGRWEWPDQERILVQTILAEPGVEQGIEEALHGLAAVQALLRRPELAGRAIRAVSVDRDKLSRALPLSSRAEQGKVVLVRGPWIDTFVQELASFSGDGSTYDDQVDAASGALAMLERRVRPEYAPSPWR